MLGCPRSLARCNSVLPHPSLPRLRPPLLASGCRCRTRLVRIRRPGCTVRPRLPRLAYLGLRQGCAPPPPARPSPCRSASGAPPLLDPVRAARSSSSRAEPRAPLDPAQGRAALGLVLWSIPHRAALCSSLRSGPRLSCSTGCIGESLHHALPARGRFLWPRSLPGSRSPRSRSS